MTLINRLLLASAQRTFAGVLCCVLLTFPHLLFAQLPQNWGAVFQTIDVTALQGYRFKMTAAVRAECAQPQAHAALWVRIDKADRSTGFFNNMSDRPIRDSQWNTYTIAGRIDKGAKWLYLGGIFDHKGKFQFDDFHLSVEKNGAWEEIPVNDPGFEGDTSMLRKSWLYHRLKNFAVSLSTGSPYEGHSSLLVDGSNFVEVKSATFGNNDSVGRFIKANGISLYVETYGQGEPLLLLHGNSSNIYSFRQQIPELSKRYRVIAVDSRGQGRSSEDGKTYSYDLFAEDMNALLDTMHLDSVNILGWSDGGNTGLIMAMKYPRKVKKLATMGANVFIDNSVVEKWVFDTLRAQQRELAGDTAAWSRNRSRLITLLLTEPQHRFDELTAIRCPVLVMAGQHDVILEPHTRAIAKHITGASLVIFKKGTHEEPWEHPERFNKTVIDFFSRSSP